MSGQEFAEYDTPLYDNRRWEGFESRPGDIFVCTPAKCGTTWMQTIVANLVFPDGDFPMPVNAMSPWIEFRMIPEQLMHEALAAQTHRRFMKSHTPADGIPWFDDARYIVVCRDGRDAFMSLCNHVERMKHKGVIDEGAVARGQEPLPDFDGDLPAFFTRWLEFEDNVPRMLAGYWERRRRPNVLLVHFNDLKRDLPGEMRRVADFLDIELDDEQWGACAERCSFDYMRSHPEMVGDFEPMFEGGTRGFIFKGTNDRWRDVLGAGDVAAYEKHAAEVLAPDALAWLESGRGALDPRV